MLSAKISREFKNGWIFVSLNFTSRVSISSNRYQALFRIFTSMSDSSLRVIVLSSLVNPYPEFHTEWAKCNAQTLVNKASNWINWSKKKGGEGGKIMRQNHSWMILPPFFLFLVFWSNCHGGRLSERGGWYKLKKRIWEWASVRSFTVKCSLHFHELLIVLSTGFDSGFRQDVFTQEDYHYLDLPWLVQDIQCLSRYSMSTTALSAIFKELCHEIYQNSNRRNCHTKLNETLK